MKLDDFYKMLREPDSPAKTAGLRIMAEEIVPNARKGMSRNQWKRWKKKHWQIMRYYLLPADAGKPKTEVKP